MSFLKSGWYLQVWQYGGGTAAEQSIDGAISLALEYGAAGIAPKVLDGLTWMGNVNTGHGVPRSVDDVMLDAQRCRAAGLLYLPWVNPLYGNDNFLDQEAALYGEIGKQAGYFVWDSEPYDQFWGANRPAGAAWRLLEGFRNRAAHCVNIWQPDPRPGRLTELRPNEWAPWMNVYAPQSYWTDFGTDVTSEIDRAANQATQVGIAECAPTIPANGDPGVYPEALERMAVRGISACLAWRMGTLGAGHLSMLRDLAPAGHVEPEPQPEPEPTDELARLRQQLEGMRILADDVAYERLGRNLEALRVTADVMQSAAKAMLANIGEIEATRTEARRIRIEQIGEP